MLRRSIINHSAHMGHLRQSARVVSLVPGLAPPLLVGNGCGRFPVV